MARINLEKAREYDTKYKAQKGSSLLDREKAASYDAEYQVKMNAPQVETPAEEKSALSRIRSGAKSIGTSLAATPFVLGEAAGETAKGLGGYLAEKWSPETLKRVGNELLHGGDADNKPEYVEIGDHLGEMDDDSLGMKMMRKSNEYRQEATEGMSGPGAFLADTAIGIANSAVTLPTAAINPTLPLAIMGAQSAAQKAYDVSESGGSAAEAFGRGTVAGAIEAITEKIPLDTLLDVVKTGGKSGLRNILKQAGVEAGEESISYLVNLAADKIAKDENAQFSAKDLGLSALGGALSGGVFGTTGTVANRLFNRGNAATLPVAEQRTEAATLPVANNQKLNIDNTDSAQYNNLNEGGTENGRNQLYGTSGEGIRAGQGRTTSDLPVEKRRGSGQGDLRVSGVVLLSPKSQQTLSQRGVVNVELHDSSADSAAFSSALDAARKADAKNGWAVSPKTAEEAAKLKTFMDANGTTGFAIAPDGDIEAVFANKAAGAPKGVTKSIIPQAIANGGTKLDCYGHKLAGLYSEGGFIPVARVLFNPAFSNDGWTPDKGTPDVYFMMHNGDSADTVVENYGKYKVWTKAELDALPAMDYTAGAAYRDSLLAKQQEAQKAGKAATLPVAEPKAAVTLPVAESGHPPNAESSVGAAESGFDPWSNFQNQRDKFHPEGANAARPVDVPTTDPQGGNVSKTASTVMGAKGVTNDFVSMVQDMVMAGELSYDKVTDQASIDRAKQTIQTKGFQGAVNEFSNAVQKGYASKDLTTLGQQLLIQSTNAGDYDSAAVLLTLYRQMGTNVAQAEQAMSILRKLPPDSQLYAVKYTLDDLRKVVAKKYGDQLTIDPDLEKKFLAQTDQTGRDAVMDEIIKDIAQRVPSTWKDKWNAWRYLSMLGNFRSHSRNTVGNAIWQPVRMTKDAVATLIEKGYSKATGGKLERAKTAVADPALYREALKDWDNVKDSVSGTQKYNENYSAIEGERKIFSLPVLEKARKTNSALLEYEDGIFKKLIYADSLAKYLKANGATAEQFTGGEVDQKLLSRARKYAGQEALKGTFNDRNAFADFVSSIGKYHGDNKVAKAASTIIEGVLPFRRTPANILARGVEYSPAGLAKGLTYDLAKVKSGEMSAAQAIDNISAGLTGSALMLLGAVLTAGGIISAGEDDDEKQAAMDDLTGKQNYALNIGDSSYTLDWAAPAALPFFMGAELADSLMKDGVTADGLESALSSISEPMLEMSMLQSLNDIIDNVSYSDNKLADVVKSALVSYFSQGIPTALGQVERTTEDKRMTTYTDKTLPISTDTQYALGKVAQRLPIYNLATGEDMADFNQIPYIDAWGREEKTGSVGNRAFSNFVSPGYSSTTNETKVDKEIQRLYDATGEGSVVPSRADKSFKVDGETVNLNKDEYVTFAKKKGQTAYKALETVFSNKTYRAMSDADKVKVVQNIYEYASAAAKEAVSDYAADGWVEKAQDTVKKTGIGVGDYVVLYRTKQDIESLKDKDGDTITNSWGLQIMDMVYKTSGLTDTQRQALFEDFGVGKSIIHYSPEQVSKKLEEMKKKAA